MKLTLLGTEDDKALESVESKEGEGCGEDREEKEEGITQGSVESYEREEIGREWVIDKGVDEDGIPWGIESLGEGKLRRGRMVEGKGEVCDAILDMNTCQINERMRVSLEGFCHR